MLVNLNTIIKDAKANNYSVPSFTAPDLFLADVYIQAAEEVNRPVILGQAEAWQEFCDIEFFGPVMADMARRAKVPVCLHLDHGLSLEYIMKAIKAGYTSVMADFSMYSFEENVKNVAKIVEFSHAAGVSVEAMCGRMPSVYELKDNPNLDISQYFTQPDELAEFVELTKADAMAVSFGTVHNMKISKPMLDLELLKRLRDAADATLVLHGSSGVTDEQLLSVIPLGVRKINAYTKTSISAQPAIMEAVAKADEPMFYHELEVIARNAIKNTAKHTLELFGNGYDCSMRDWSDIKII